MNHHVTRLEVDVKALLANIAFFKSKVNQNTKLLVVVKAFGYGGSDVMIAKAIKNKVDYFAVAYVDEGIALRKAGITHPILVLHPQKQNLSLMIDYQLEPNCYSFLMVRHFIKEVAKKQKKRYPIHIKINTGLNRLGFDTSEIELLSKILNRQEEVEIVSVFSHIAASEDLHEKEFTNYQISKFNSICNRLFLQLKSTKKPLKHILNTSGIVNYSIDAQFDMVRLGIGTYGFGNDVKITEQLVSVLSLKSIISQIRTIKKGQSVGYSRTFISTKTMKIATIPVGYADGYSRCLGKGVGYVYVKGKKAVVVGNVCMDMIMIDVTDIDCKENDEVLLYKNQQHIEDLAKRLGTISYEMITTISKRIKRVLINSK